MKMFRSLMAAAGLLVAASMPAHAVEVPLATGQWTPFQFDGVDSVWHLQGLAEPVGFRFTSDVPVTLQVVDTFNSGDQFAVFDQGLRLGDTTVPIPGADTDAFDTAFNDPAGSWSRGAFILPAGTHVISGLAIQSPFGTGTGGLRIISGQTLPEPATWMLLVFALALGWRRLAR